MKNIILSVFLLLTAPAVSQIISVDSLKNSLYENIQDGVIIKDSIKKKNFIVNKVNQQEAVWDNGVPIIPDDENVMELITELNEEAISDVNKLTKDQVRIYRELGIEFYNRGMYEEADFYLSKIKNYTEVKHLALKEVFKDDKSEIKKQIKEELEKQYQAELEKLKEEPKKELTEDERKNVQKDVEFTKSLPSKLTELSKEDLEQLSKKIDSQIQKLTQERDDLVKNNGSQQLIDSKNTSIKSLNKEKQVIDLNINNEELKEETTIIKRWLWIAIISISVLILLILVLLQRKKIKVQDVEIENQLKAILKKNTYLEHAARIIRHDMHSGINTYIPRGISSLEKKLDEETVKNLKLTPSLTMIKEGLHHTQRVYKSVYEFTNLVKRKSVLEKSKVNLETLINSFIANTAYKNQVIVEDLVEAEVNESLFCTAIDNIIRNGLKYNNSSSKTVQIYFEKGDLVIQDNGKGFSQEDFEKLLSSKNEEDETGLGLKITNAIIFEHGFKMGFEKNDIGTKVKITLNLK